MKRKITVTTGTRADYGILRPVLKKIKSNPMLKLNLIITGMHLSSKYGKTIDEIKKDGFSITNTINFLPKKDTNYDMSLAIGQGIISFSKIFEKIKPDVNLLMGDRDEMLASAIAAYHMNIPNAHIHGGDRSKGGIDEYNRHAITKISNIHFAASKKSYERILKMGENPKYVFLTGSPSIDEIKDKKITSKKLLEKKYKLKFKGDEVLLLQHPVTTQSEESKKQIIETLSALSKLKMSTIAILPNSDPGNKDVFDTLKKYSKKFDFIKIYPTLPRSDFLGFLKYSKIFLGNSSSGMIEASYFHTPVINIGIRQKGRESGSNVIHVGNSKNEIISAIRYCLRKNSNYKKQNFYGSGSSSKKIVRHLESIKLDKELIKKQIFY
jgi:UDP-N-acetylglucosamine 2-epimerase (non-hydrolysing)/GDP/UDP-N,N'-diacetylbacillosamine 2-epimerase (hydrolysing)